MSEIKFCPECQSHMIKTFDREKNIIFECRCKYTINGEDDDTLMFEQQFTTEESNLKHETFIEMSPFDTAANIVRKDCPKCNLDFLILIRVSENQNIMYTCSCGYRSNYGE